MREKLERAARGQVTASIFYILFGLCLVLMPVKTVDILCKVVFGLAMIGAGAYHVYVFVAEKENSTILDLFSGVIVLVLGGFLFTNPQIVVKLLPLLLGAFVLVDSIWTLRGAFRLKRRGSGLWKAFLIISLVFVALGIFLTVWNYAELRTMVTVAGAIFLGNGVLDIIFYILLGHAMKKPVMMDEDSGSHVSREGEKKKKAAWRKALFSGPEPGKEEPAIVPEPMKEEPAVVPEPRKEEPAVVPEPGKDAPVSSVESLVQEAPEPPARETEEPEDNREKETDEPEALEEWKD